MPGKREPEEVRREQILRAAFEVASREGIGNLTVRAVAAEADLSHALVLFHFKRKQRLVQELLDWLLDSTSVLRVSQDIAEHSQAVDRLHALLEQEMQRLTSEPRHVRLFLEYWALGVRHPVIRTRIGAELERYRLAFRAVIEEMLRVDPPSRARVTADGMAAVAVSWIHGCAVQAMVDPENFDTGEYLKAVRALVGQLA